MMMTGAAVLAVCLALPGPAAPRHHDPQVATSPADAPVTGTVRDGSGRVVPGAVVIVRPASGPEVQSATTADGRFAILRPAG